MTLSTTDDAMTTGVSHHPWFHLLALIAAELQPCADGFGVYGAAGLLAIREQDPRIRMSVLVRVLYSRYYHRREQDVPTDPRQDRTNRRPSFAQEDPGLGRQLRNALSDRYYWEPGWEDAGRASGGHKLARRDGLVLHLAADEQKTTGQGVAVRFPACRPYVSPGFFGTISRHGPASPADSTVRCYLHLHADFAVGVFRDVVVNLEGAGLPFSAKVLNNPRAFGRPDSAVLYLRRRDLRRAVDTVLETTSGHPRLAYGNSTPAFTHPIAPGVALADEPTGATSVSFGSHRSQILGRALMSTVPDDGPEVRRTAMERALLAAGLDLQRLHLNPGAADYDLPDAPLMDTAAA